MLDFLQEGVVGSMKNLFVYVFAPGQVGREIYRNFRIRRVCRDFREYHLPHTRSRPVYLVDSPGFGDGEHLHRTLGCNVLDREDFYRGTVKING